LDPICLGEYRDGFASQFIAGPDDAAGNLAAVGNEDLIEHGERG
jgi:hypothetical protein